MTGFTNYIPVIHPFEANAALCAALFKIALGDFVNLWYGSTERFEFDVPIVYGQIVGLGTTFRVRSFTDTMFQGSSTNPFFEHWGAIAIDEISVDFLNTAELIAIVDADNPTATVTGLGRDYSALVTAEAPAVVPIPGALILMTGGLVSLLGAGIRRRYRPI